MYSTCLFCSTALGANEAIEAFPVGRRLAFDAAKGRLWVVCRRCGRWNLTPLEERWEAIEQCERAFAATRLRVSTDHVGLARLKEGLELVRIGAPQRPEMAAWRYGDQFGRRRRRAMLRVGAGVAAVGAVVAGGAAAGISVGMFASLIWTLTQRATGTGSDVTVARIVPGDGRRAWTIKRRHLDDCRIGHEEDGTFAVKLAHDEGGERLHGPAAVAAAQRLLVAANRFGGSSQQVRAAVEELESTGSAERYMREMYRRDRRRERAERWSGDGAGPVRLAWWRGEHVLGLSPMRRLALEMALHEEQERRALEGELAELARAWREAEEIAAIADGLFVGDEVTRKLDGLRGGRRSD